MSLLSFPERACVSPHPQDSPPRLSRVLQACPRSGGGGAQPSSRASSRVLHLDPEFINTPGGGGGGANQVLEQSLETFLEREGRGGHDSELGLTPVRVVPFTPARIQAEVSVPPPPHAPQAVPRPRGLLGLERVCVLLPGSGPGWILHPHRPPRKERSSRPGKREQGLHPQRR